MTSILYSSVRGSNNFKSLNKNKTGRDVVCVCGGGGGGGEWELESFKIYKFKYLKKEFQSHDVI